MVPSLLPLHEKEGGKFSLTDYMWDSGKLCFGFIVSRSLSCLAEGLGRDLGRGLV